MRQKVSLGLISFDECTARVKLELTDFSIDCQIVKSTVNIDYVNKCKEHLTKTLVHDGHRPLELQLGY